MNVKIRYKCPYCGRSIEHNPAYAGTLVVCSACKGEFYEPTDPLPGRAADKALTRKSASAKPPIPRNPVGYDPDAGGDEGEKPTEKATEAKAPATTKAEPSGPRIKEPKSSQPKETGSPLGGSLWEQASDEPKAKSVSKPTSKPEKMVLPTSSKAQSTGAPSKPATGFGKTASGKPSPSSMSDDLSSDDVQDSEIDFQAIISSELGKPKAPTPPLAKPAPKPAEGTAKPTAPMARPATASAGGAPAARPATTSTTTHHSGGNSLQTATPTDMANELRRRGLFGAIVFGDPTKPDQAQLALSDNMTRDDAKTFIMKLFSISKSPGADEQKSGGMFGRFFGGGKENQEKK